MAHAKKHKTKKSLGRDSKGNPVALESNPIKSLGSDRTALAQRRGDGLKASMNKEHELLRKRRPK